MSKSSGCAREGEPLAFLLAHVNDPHGDDDPCVLWPSEWAVQRQWGYGRIRYEGRARTAHNVLCELRDGPPPEGRPFAIHGPCHSPLCVVHVRWGSPAENTADRRRDGTASSRPTTR